MINKLPCITDKCLLLPICISKETISCDNISRVIEDSILNSRNTNNPYDYLEAKTIIFKELFTNTKLIYGNTRSKIFYMRR